jgi:hypothetical protein
MNTGQMPCPACPGAWELPSGYIEELVAARRSSGLDNVDERTYLRRLAACSACNACLDGSVCMKCGCFVQLRALSALRDCPHPGGDRWAYIKEAESE